MKIKTFQASSDSLNGIIAYLFDSFKENYDTFVSVRVSSTDYASGWREESLIIPTRNSTSLEDNWASINKEKSNFTVYFHKHAIGITKYSLRSQSYHQMDFPKSWVVEGSLDGKKWNLVDEKNDRNELVGSGYLKTFEVEHKGKYSCFRFTQTGINSYNRHHFDLGKVEFFGTLYTKYTLKATSCNCLRKTSSIFMFMVSLFAC